MLALISGFAVLLALFLPGIFSETEEALLRRAQDIFVPLKAPEYLPGSLEEQEVALGRKLFFDSRISRDGSVSCASCHRPESFAADQNTPSVLNLRFHQIFGWRGDGGNLENRTKMSFTQSDGLGNISVDETLRKLRTAGYGPNMTIEKAVSALSAYQLSLVTTGSAFDRFLEGDLSALSKTQKNGLRQFIHLACVSCHAGAAIGAKDVIRFGLTRDYWTVTGSVPVEKGPSGEKSYDFGRMDITGNSNDKNAFKIPSLRNVAMTAPYFHDGSAKDLDTAIRWMGELQLDRKLTDIEVSELKSFLESLTGELPKSFHP